MILFQNFSYSYRNFRDWDNFQAKLNFQIYIA